MSPPKWATAVLVAALALPGIAAELRGQTGLASFYGKRFQGRTTASGKRFDENRLTAAHPTYPAGTRLRVTNLENGRSVEVHVTDRGPTHPHRRRGVVIDLSTAAARRLGFVHDGRAPVHIEPIDDQPPSPRAPKK